MKTEVVLAIAAAGVLALGVPAGVLAAVGAGNADADAAEHEPTHDRHAHGDPAGAHDHARTRTAWEREDGRVPTEADLESMTRVRDLVIREAVDLTDDALMDFVNGKGTRDDPYVIENLYVLDDLHLADTTDYFVIRGNYVAGQLTLNWNDDRVYVHHNYVRDLRVNENVERVGEATGGWITENVIGYVGQIRHYDGVFSHNTVGPMPEGPFEAAVNDAGEAVPWFRETKIMNIDGFSGAVFEENEIFGWVEMQLHGHHHASCFDCHSHNHGDLKKAAKHDHSVRYHEGWFRDNVITVDDGLAFRYTDAGHAGDDRTATSEPEESLEGPHVHYTRVAITGNKLLGGGLEIDIFNADDRYHEEENPGEIMVKGNEIHLVDLREPADTRFTTYDRLRDGIRAWNAKEMKLRIVDNTLSYEARGSENPANGLLREAPWAGEWIAGANPAGVSVTEMDAGDVIVTGNAIEGFHTGLRLHRFDDVALRVDGNTFSGVEDEMDTDETVDA